MLKFSSKNKLIEVSNNKGLVKSLGKKAKCLNHYKIMSILSAFIMIRENPVKR